MYSDVEEHAARIERLQNTDRKQVLKSKLHALVQAVRNNELSVEEICQYTNISREHIGEMLAAANQI